MNKSVACGAILLMSALTPLAQAQVKKCTDGNGKVTYTQSACPKATQKDHTMMTYTPTSSASPNQGRDLYEENKAFNQRQAQRDYLSSVETQNRMAIDAFHKAADKPLAPGQVRETTLTFTNPKMDMKSKR